MNTLTTFRFLFLLALPAALGAQDVECRQKAERLAAYFNFSTARAAWAYHLDSARFALIDREGRQLTGFIYDQPQPFHDGLALARADNQYVFLDDRGTEKTQRFDFVMATDADSYIAGWTIKGRYPGAGDEISTQLLRLKQTPAGARFEIISTTSSTGVSPREISPRFYDGLACVRKDNKWGYTNSSGAFRIPPQFDEAGDFRNGRALAVKDGQWGCIDSSGAFCIPPQFDLAGPFQNDRAWIVMAGKWGYIDRGGAIIAAPQFDAAGNFQNGRAKVKKAGKWGYIDSSGAIILPPQFDEAGFFYNGCARVIKAGKWGYIDSNGHFLLPCQYTKISPCAYDTWITEQNGRLGLYSGHYQITIPAGYEEFGLLNEEGGWIRARRNGKWGWIDRQGKVMIPFRYDAAAPFFQGKAEVRQEPYPKFFEINRKGQMAVK